MPVDGVQRARIQVGDKHMQLVRDADRFELVTGTRTPVPLARGNARLTQLVDGQGDFIGSSDLKELGLDPPQGSVVVTGIPPGALDEVEERVELGRPAADGRLPIRRVADGSLLWLGRDMARAFEVDTVLLRDEKVLEIPADRIGWIEVATPAWTQELERSAELFELKKPTGFAVDAVVASEVADTLAHLEAVQWVSDEDDGSFGLDTPSLTLRFVEGDSPQRELRVGRKTIGGAFATLDSEGVFVLSKHTVSIFAGLWISRAAFGVEPETLTEVTLNTQDLQLQLVRRGDALVERTGRIEAAHAAEIVSALSDLRAERAVSVGAPLPSQGLNPPLLRIRLKHGAKHSELWIGARDVHDGASIHFARVAGVNATFVVLQASVHKLLDLL
jgi:hypothetical protein